MLILTQQRRAYSSDLPDGWDLVNDRHRVPIDPRELRYAFLPLSQPPRLVGLFNSMRACVGLDTENKRAEVIPSIGEKYVSE